MLAGGVYKNTRTHTVTSCVDTMTLNINTSQTQLTIATKVVKTPWANKVLAHVIKNNYDLAPSDIFFPNLK